MILRSLLVGLREYKIVGDPNINIESLSHSSKDVKSGGLFFCLSGTKTKGELYINEALKNNAVAIVSEKKCIANVTQIIVKNARIAMAVISANFFDNPQNKLKIVGITGTNGKTSCSYIIGSILKGLGKSVGIIGTNGIYINHQKFESNMTTPDSIELFSIFNEMVKNSVEFCIMEVSAHAIYFDKIYGIDFAVKALTNVTFDHLDFFKTKRNYELTKEKFFNNGKNFVFNNDDKIGKKLAKKHKNSLNFGKNNANLRYFNINASLDGLNFSIEYNKKNYQIQSRLIGEFNILNICLSIGVLIFLGFKIENIIEQIEKIENLPGRFDLIKNDLNIPIVIDYAHTYESLNSFLCQIKKLSLNKNIIVFGAPGERDTTKRFSMGKLAGELCDCVILTSDNPASENPRRIMFEMEYGVKASYAKCYLIENRKQAIKKAISMANKQKNCNVLIVGKGIETCQIIGDQFVPYSDYDAVLNALKQIDKK